MAHEGNEAAAFENFRGKRAAMLFDEPQFLAVLVADGNNHAAAFGKLREQRLRRRRSRRRNQDRVERRKFGKPERPIAAMYMHIVIAEGSQFCGGGRGKFRTPLD